MWSMAQTSSTSLQGTVTDPDGRAIAGAKVVLSSQESKTARETETGTQGDYRLPALPPGTYNLTVSATGFTSYEQRGLQLLVSTPATANVQMRVGAPTETVTVAGEAPTLNMVDASLGNSFEEIQVRQVPLEGRNVPDLLSLQAGVAYTGNRPDINQDEDTRSGSVNGARSDQSNITLDGVDVNNQSAGYAFTSVLPITLDSVQEFRVTTTNYNADQGQGSGAQVALVTKSGTNNFHGSLYEYHRNTITSANDYFIKAAEARLGQPNKPLKLLRNIFGASVGGPLKKDRLFFFANYEGTREREEESVVRNIPTPTLCQGQIRYQDANGGITTLYPQDIANLDKNVIGATPGINPVVLDLTNHNGYFNKTFCTGQFTTNDPSVGDGMNYSGFRFRAPVKLDNNAFITRLDYHLTGDGKHTLFWRGAMQNLSNPQAPFLPGSPAEQTVTDHSKGFALGYTAVLSNALVNTFHWGFTRQSTAVIGNSKEAWVQFFSLDQGYTYSHSSQAPTNSLLDDLAWTKGSHTFQMGANIDFVRNPRLSYQHSFSIGKGATNWMSPTGFSNTAGPGCTGGSSLDPCYIGKAEPASSTAYDFPMLALLGMVTNVVANYNYNKDGSLITPGLPISRRYGVNSYEFYGQDTWRMKSNLTVTYGLRWSLFPPPWEINGFEAVPTTSLGADFVQNEANMKKGIGYASTPLVSFMLGGAANNAPGFYHFEKTDFSPRVSLAYSPRPETGWLRKLVGDGNKTVIRGGVGRVYDRAGMQLISTFDANAPAGLSATVQNPCCIPGVDDANDSPRLAPGSTIHDIPQTNSAGAVFFTPPPPGQFPQTPPAFGQAITWGVDDTIKTPYAWTMDLSVGRELPKGLSVEVAYVGRLGRHLLTQRDLRQPLDLVDPKTGIDYYAAATRISQLARQGICPTQLTDAMIGPTAQYWQDMITAPANTTYSVYPPACVNSPMYTTSSVAQAVYALYTGTGAYPGNEVVGLGNIDLYGLLTDTGGTPYYFNGASGNMLNNQFTSMYAWSSIGSSNYNALQVTVRKKIGSGFQFDFNYTYSKSIDITSAAARLGYSASVNVGAPGVRLVNAFSPRARRAVSDWDTPHQFNANWIYDLPFGEGRAVGRNASGWKNEVIGGWQLSGLTRWTSGFPFTVDNGNFWPTDWDQNGIATMIQKPKTGAFRQPDGSVSVFGNPAAAMNDFIHPFPGSSGSRNVVRGDGYANLDMALAKRWKVREGQSLQFRWEVFNVPNLVRFNVLAGGGLTPPSLQQVPSAFGDYTGLLTQPRVMQFALRYEF